MTVAQDEVLVDVRRSSDEEDEGLVAGEDEAGRGDPVHRLRRVVPMGSEGSRHLGISQPLEV